MLTDMMNNIEPIILTKQVVKLTKKQSDKEDNQYDYASDPDRKSNPLPTEVETTYSL